MGEARNRPRLAPEARRELGVARQEAVQDFERQRPSVAILDGKDLAHAARAELAAHAIPPLQKLAHHLFTIPSQPLCFSGSACLYPRVQLAGGRSYLLVLQGDSSSLFQLPSRGEVMIGRAPECDLCLADDGVSRQHAQLSIADGQIRMVDRQSHDGTRVNGELIGGESFLCSGDVVTLGAVTLVLHSASTPQTRRRLHELAAFRQRLREEIERAVQYDRPLHLLAIDLGSVDWARLTANRATTALALDAELRLIDIAGQSGEGQLFVAVPELSRDAALKLAERLIVALQPIAPAAKVGLAGLPSDAGDEPALVAAARSAMAVAEPQRVRDAADCVVRLELGRHHIVLADPAMLRTWELIRRIGKSELAVLLLGETGVGKDVAAHLVHGASRRAQGPLVALNCAALPDNLLESELFGYEKGAFTGALAKKPGLLETASGGTLFLDEIGELPASSQAKLLRALETRRVLPLGATRERDIDVRLVAATNRNLEERVKAGSFRQDLYFRLSGATVVLPPLRERPREIALVGRVLLDGACAALGRAPMHISAVTLRYLQSYAWPGNLRELKNVMEYAAAAAAAGEELLQPWHLPTSLSGDAAEGKSASPPERPGSRFRPVAEELRELERQRMREALDAADGVQTRAAELIGMPLRTFVMKLKQYGLSSRRGEGAP
jgi:DNA-binding NtrC family response regulator